MAKRMIKGLLIDVENGKVEVVEIPQKLEEYYKLLNVECIDIVNRYIANELYTIVCDDEALLKENPQLSAVDYWNKPMLYGNLFITKYTDSEYLESLSDEDVDRLRNCITDVQVYYDTNYVGNYVRVNYMSYKKIKQGERY